MVTLPEMSKPSDPAETISSVPSFHVKLLLPWMPSLSVSGIMMEPELTVILPSTEMPCLALPVTCMVPLPLTVRSPATYNAPLIELLALSAIIEPPLRIKVAFADEAMLMAAVLLLVSDNSFSVKEKELML